MYPETTAFKSTRPSGSGDLAQLSKGHGYSGFALEAREQAVLVAKEFVTAVKVKFLDEVDRDKILAFDESLRAAGRGKRTIAIKRQRLQSMLRWAGIDTKVFPPKPKFEKKLPTIYTPVELAAMFNAANSYQRMVCNLALKLGLRDQGRVVRLSLG